MSRRPVVFTAPALLAAVAGVSYLAVEGQADARTSLEDRFRGRADVAAAFVGSFVADVFDREAVAATLHLSGPSPTALQLAGAAAGQRMSGAVLLDADGRALATYPDDPSVVGVDLAERHGHLGAALDGQRAVSAVVPSATTGAPVVSFALPFDTPYGRRVFSGAIDVRSTPMSEFLGNASPIGGHRAYLVDRHLRIVASAGRDQGALGDIEPALAWAVVEQVEGGFAQQGADHRFVGRTVAGAPWRLVLAVPSEELYQPLTAIRRSTYAVLAVLAALTLWVVRLLVVVTQRARQLARAAGTDPLTGVGNRRHLEEWVAGSEVDTDVVALVIDLDHFKAVNDRWGHAVGDEVLRAIAHRLSSGVRDADQVVRWGGEEFAVVLRGVDLPSGQRTAERLHDALRRPIATSVGDLELTASIGVAPGTAGSLGPALAAADAALFEAKRAGRDAIVTAWADEVRGALASDMPLTLAAGSQPRTHVREIARQPGAAVTLRVVGDLDVSTVDAVVDDIERVPPEPEVLIDLSEVTFLDCAGLGGLLQVRSELEPRSTSVRIISPSEPAARVLELTGVADCVDTRS